ncbi:MAG: hydroxyacylglutathione hydrolase [Acetobacter papayae]|uniref:hydroxyacylglutathione hydrolase n=1 Tax=Acetobacter papayae TaxID=1076592 RepID=UPI0039EB4BD1
MLQPQPQATPAAHQAHGLDIRGIPLFTDNYAWLLQDRATGTIAVVDPGDSAPVEAALAPYGGRLDLILLTHHHADHIGGAQALRALTGAKLAGPAADQHRLPQLDIPLTDGENIAIGDSAGTVIATPGHTLGHICYFFNDPAALFCGDTLFSLGCGRLFEGTATQLFDSLHRLSALPPETLVYCGHEYTLSNASFALAVDPDNPALLQRVNDVRRLRAQSQPTIPSTLALERATNPFLRAPDSQTLAALRARKDTF